MKLRLLALCFLLVGCSAPEPKPTLVKLGEQAYADSRVREKRDPNYNGLTRGQLREKQSQQLFDEIARLCGTNKDGSTPEECRYPKGESTLPSISLSDAASHVLDSMGSAPASSRPLLATHYVQLAMKGNPVSAPLPADTDPAMRDWENGVVYAMEVSLAFSGSATPTVEKSLEAHKELVSAMPLGSTPAPAAYDLSAYPPPAQTIDFLIALESDSVSKWQDSALAAKSDDWRRYALIQAGNAAVRYAALVSARGENPFDAPFVKVS